MSVARPQAVVSAGPDGVRVTARYPAQALARAREHYAAGWTPGEIRRLIHAEFGSMPAWGTVQAWCDPKYEEKRRRRTRVAQRKLMAARGRRPFTAVTEEYRVQRMRELYLRGVSLRAIGQVSAVWWGVELTAEQVQRHLGLKSGDIAALRAERNAA